MPPIPRRLAVPGLLLALLAPVATARAQSADRIWGTVHTHDGQRHEGFLRFGGGPQRGHAANWTDLLIGRENIRDEPFRVWIDSARGGGPFLRTVELKGYRISWNELNNDAIPRYIRFAVPFGAIQEIIVHELGPPSLPTMSRARVEVVLRPLNEAGGGGTGDRERRWLMGESAQFWTGEHIEVETDLGGRERLVGGVHYSRIEFAAAPPGATTSSERLYGTIEDASGRPFTGLVIWRDWKLSPSNTLDGWTDRSSPRSIAFDSVRTVERLPGGTDEESDPGVRVTLVTGEVIDLPERTERGSFSIAVLDPGLGRVSVSSRNVWSLRFHGPGEGPDTGSTGPSPLGEAGYDSFGDGAYLRGTVVTQDGEEYEGRIRWGTPKATTWDHLGGTSDGVGMDVRFARIRRVEQLEFPYGEPVRVGGAGGTEFQRGRVRVTLLDGRSFEMSGYSDLGELNVGVLVLPAGQDEASGWRRVGWEDLREVRFEHPRTGGVRPPDRAGWR